MTASDKAILQLAHDFMHALENCDVTAVRRIYAPDAKLWHNFDQKLQSVEENIKMLEWLHVKLKDIIYQIVRRELVTGGFLQQHVLCGTLNSGESFAMPACAIVKVEGGKIVSLEEYLDTSHTKPLRAS